MEIVACASVPELRVSGGAATFPAAIAGYRVRLFAARLPKELTRHTHTASVESLPNKISETNRDGRVVACDSVGGPLPLTSCKP
jgi:hypothetical protein